MSVFYVLRTVGRQFPSYRGETGTVRTVYEAKRYPDRRSALKESGPGWVVLRVKHIEVK